MKFKKEPKYEEPKIHAEGECDKSIPLCKTKKYDYRWSSHMDRMTCTKCLSILNNRINLSIRLKEYERKQKLEGELNEY